MMWTDDCGQGQKELKIDLFVHGLIDFSRELVGDSEEAGEHRGVQ